MRKVEFDKLAITNGSEPVNVTWLAGCLGLSRSAVNQWTRVPVDHAKKVSELCGIPLNKLRPDIWD